MPAWDAMTPDAREAISNILSTADKYDVVRLLRPFVPVFIPHARVDDHVVKRDKLGTLRALNIAWHLGTIKLVKAALQQVFLSLSGDNLGELLTYAQGYPSMGMSLELWELLEGVRTHRETAMQYLLDYVHGKAELRDNNQTGWNCKKAVLDGPGLKVVRRDGVPFLGPAATMELHQLHEMQRRQCDALMHVQIQNRLTLSKGWETPQSKPRRLGRPLVSL